MKRILAGLLIIGLLAAALPAAAAQNAAVDLCFRALDHTSTDLNRAGTATAKITTGDQAEGSGCLTTTWSAAGNQLMMYFYTYGQKSDAVTADGGSQLYFDGTAYYLTLDLWCSDISVLKNFTGDSQVNVDAWANRNKWGASAGRCVKTDMKAAIAACHDGWNHLCIPMSYSSDLIGTTVTLGDFRIFYTGISMPAGFTVKVDDIRFMNQSAVSAILPYRSAAKDITQDIRTADLSDQSACQALVSRYQALPTDYRSLVLGYDAFCDEYDERYGSADQQAKDQAAADRVMALIGALPAAENLKESDESAILAAQEAYQLLSIRQKELVTNLSRLTTIIEAFNSRFTVLDISLHSADMTSGLQLVSGNIHNAHSVTDDCTEGQAAFYSNWNGETGAYKKWYMSLINLGGVDLTGAKYLTFDVYVHGFSLQSYGDVILTMGSDKAWNSNDILFCRTPLRNAEAGLREGWNFVVVPLTDNSGTPISGGSLNSLALWHEQSVLISSSDAYVVYDDFRLLDQRAYDRLFADRCAAKKVIAAINCMDYTSLTQVNTVTKAYEALTLTQKRMVSNKSDLFFAQARTAVASVQAQIQALPAAGSVTASHRDAIVAADRAYQALNETKKAQISASQVLKLTQVKSALQTALTKSLTLTVGTDNAAKGEQATLAVTVSGASAGDLAALQVVVGYDDTLLQAGDPLFTTGSLWSDPTVVTNAGAFAAIDTAGVTGNGTLFSLNFTVLETLSKSGTPVTLTVNAASHKDEQAGLPDYARRRYTFTVNNGRVDAGVPAQDPDEQIAGAVVALIAALPASTAVKAADKTKVATARAAYDALTADQKKLVTNLSVLTAAEGVIAAADEVQTAIAKLPSTVKTTDGGAIEAARAAYEALTANQKGMVTNLGTLEAAEAALAALLDQADADAVIAMIAALPASTAVKSADKAKVATARAAYDALTADQKKLVTNLSVLTAAEGVIAAADEVQTAIAKLPSTVKTTDEGAIEAARAAYEALTANQKGMVTNLGTLEAAEAALVKAFDQAAADVVIGKIGALPSAAYVKNSHKSAIAAARGAYDALTADQKKLVTNLSVLTAAEGVVAAADEVQTAIAKLPSADAITTGDQTAIEAARAAYKKLTSNQKGMVTNLSTLEAAEAALAALFDQADADAVMAMIAALPAPAAVQSADKTKAAAARGAYNALTADQKKRVTNLALLEAVEAVITAAADVEAEIAALPAVNKLSANDFGALALARTHYNELTAAAKGLVGNLSTLTALEAQKAVLEQQMDDAAKAAVVIEQISKLPAVVKTTDGEAIEAARGAYEGLTADQQKLVTNLAKLVSAEAALVKAFDQAAADVVKAQIAQLPIPSALQATHKPAITAARGAYDALTADQKKLVPNLASLEALETVIKAAADVEAEIAALPEVSNLSTGDFGALLIARSHYDGLINAGKGLVGNLSKLIALEAQKAVLEQETDDAAKAAVVTEQISKLPSTVKTTDRGAIEAARAAYNALTADQQKLVTNLAKLVSAETALAKAFDQAAADEVIGKIGALPAAAYVKNSHKSAITAARAAYNALTADQKKLVTNLSVLTAAEGVVAAADAVQSTIAKLPSVYVVKVSDRATIEAARAAYEGLTANQKGMITNLSTLEAAEAALSALSDRSAADTVIGLIGALPSAAYVKNSHKSAIAAARTAYDALTADQKKLITNLSVLTAAESVVAAADAVQATIAQLPSAVVVKTSDQTTIEAARAAYEKLTANQKGMVTNLGTLEAAEAALAALFDQAAADVVIGKIGVLPAAAYVKNSHKSAIAAARAAYDALTANQKKRVTNLSVLTAAESVVAAADAVQATIAKLPSAGGVKTGDQSAIEAARAAYEKLTANQKGMVTNLGTLEAAEAALAALFDQAAADVVIGKIGALPAAANVKPADKANITAARGAYEGLTADQKKLVTNLAVLTAAEGVVAAADEVTAEIEQLPAVAELTAAHFGALLTARSHYDGLSAAAKGLVENLSKLTALEAQKAVVEQQMDDAAKAAAVIEQIGKLPAPQAIRPEDCSVIEAARAAYDALPEGVRARVTNLDTLEAAEVALAAVMDRSAADAVIAAIAALPAPDKITPDDGTEIFAVQAAYNALPVSQQAWVPAQSLTVLETAEAAWLAAVQKVIEEGQKARQELADAQAAKATAQAMLEKAQSDAEAALAKSLAAQTALALAEQEEQTAKAEQQIAEAAIAKALQDEQTAKSQQQTAEAEMAQAKEETQTAKAQQQTAEAAIAKARQETQAAKTAEEQAKQESKTAQAALEQAQQEKQTAEAELARAKEEQKQAEDESAEAMRVIAECNQIIADAAAKIINALPDAASVTPGDREAIEAARRTYDKLNQEQKALVPAAAVRRLEEAEKALNKPSETDYGDVSGDGRIDASDALMSLKVAVNKITLTAAQQKAADVNGDGRVDASDALLMLKFAVGKIKTFPVNEG